MGVARTQHAAFQITELIEHEQRVIAGDFETEEEERTAAPP